MKRTNYSSLSNKQCSGNPFNQVDNRDTFCRHSQLVFLSARQLAQVNPVKFGSNGGSQMLHFGSSREQALLLWISEQSAFSDGDVLKRRPLDVWEVRLDAQSDDKRQVKYHVDMHTL